jgi:hypothetical protein
MESIGLSVQRHPHGQWPPFLTAALSFHSLLLARNQAATCSSVELKMALSIKLSTQQSMVVLLTTPTNSAD